jgi:hypothetical protein
MGVDIGVFDCSSLLTRLTVMDQSRATSIVRPRISIDQQGRDQTRLAVRIASYQGRIEGFRGSPAVD